MGPFAVVQPERDLERTTNLPRSPGMLSRTVFDRTGQRHCAACGCVRSFPALASRATHEYAIKVTNLVHTVGGKQVLRGVDLAVPRGTLHILAGANGCGKSTLLRVLGELVEKQSGDVQIDGPVGIVLQNPDHQIVMPTVAADVAFALGRFKLVKATLQHLVMNALRAVELEDFADRPTNTLSGGQKQRLAIAGALAQNPKVLLLDELTTFLDDDGQRLVMHAVKAAVEGPRKVTALWVTHRVEELDWADGASFMDVGQVKVSGHPVQVSSMMH